MVGSLNNYSFFSFSCRLKNAQLIQSGNCNTDSYISFPVHIYSSDLLEMALVTGRREWGGGSVRRSTGFARLCVQVSCSLRDWMVWRQFASVTGHLSWLAATLVSDWWFLAANC